MKLFIGSLFLCFICLTASSILFAVADFGSLKNKFNGEGFYKLGFDFDSGEIENTIEKEYDFKGPVDLININVAGAEIEVKGHDQDTIKIKAVISEKRKTEIRLENKELFIKEEKKNTSLKSVKNIRYTIFLPQETKANLTIEAGLISFKTSKINFKDVKINTGVGNIELTNLICNKIEIDSAAGDIDLKKIVVTSGHIEAVAGDIDIEDLKSDGNLEIEALAGNIEVLMSNASPQIKIKAMAGEIEFRLLGGVDPNFKLYYSNTIGEVEVNGNPKKINDRSYQYGDGLGLVELEANLGSIEVL